MMCMHVILPCLTKISASGQAHLAVCQARLMESRLLSQVFCNSPKHFSRSGGLKTRKRKSFAPPEAAEARSIRLIGTIDHCEESPDLSHTRRNAASFYLLLSRLCRSGRLLQNLNHQCR